MLLNHDVEFMKIQVLNSDDPHPDCSLFGQLTCVCCGNKLYGHGWRKRYFIDGDSQEYRIWLHRKRCSGCFLTFTLIPKWLDVFKLFSVAMIQTVLQAAFTTGHLGNQYPVSRSLQRQWRKQYIQRNSTFCNQYDGKFLINRLSHEPVSCITSPIKMRVLSRKLKGKMEALSFRPPGSHHHLLLFVPLGLL